MEKNTKNNIQSTADVVNKAVEKEAFNTIVSLIESHRETTYRKINEELVKMYFEVGKYLSNKITSNIWGSKIIDNIANLIKEKYPQLKGFDRANLYHMVRYYNTYCDNIIVATLSRQISWSNNILIFYRETSIEEKEFYIRLCIKHNYSFRELKRQISTRYYERYILSNGNALPSIEKTIDEDDIPATRILDTFSLEFLDLPNHYSEKDLRKAIVHNLKDFILEIGKDFTFVGEEYRINVGGQDFYIDLVFFNRTTNSLVAFELKIDEFKPEYVSKMDFYLEALDRQVKKENENPSIGIILCASKNEVVAEYTLSRTISPTLISQYSTELIDKKLLENKVASLYKMLKKDGD